MASCSSGQELTRSKEGHCVQAAERRSTCGSAARQALPGSLSIPSCRASSRIPLCLQMGHLRRSQPWLSSGAALHPGSWLGIAQGHHILTAQPQTHVRIFQYRLLIILGLYKPRRQAHVVPHLSWLLGVQDPLTSM